MKKLFLTLASAISATLLIGSAIASSPAPKTTAEEALKNLVAGNQRYLDNQLSGVKACDLEARKKLSSGQSPYAIILACSDSRVPPELIFDEGLGEIFVVRVAGNIADPIILGSVEYAAEHLGSPLIMVLGHTKCGAVKATVESDGKAEGNIGSIVKTIAPALKKAKSAKSKPADKGEFIESVVDENIKEVKSALTKKSTVLSHLVKEGKVKIVTAKYDITDGKVSIQEGLK